MNTSFLNPYLESLGSSFSNGANFAVVGSTTLPRSEPFALNIQVKQFLRFKARSLELANAGEFFVKLFMFIDYDLFVSCIRFSSLESTMCYLTSYYS